jgi:8-oxo-dGTP diphosphatase
MGARKGAGIILRNSEGRYLLVKGVYTPVWSWPKGQLEDNESFIECAQRETYEETGLIPAHYILNEIQPIKSPKRDYWYWEGRIINDNTPLYANPTEASAVGWFTQDEIALLLTNREVKWYFNRLTAINQIPTEGHY